MLPYFCKLESDGDFGDKPYHGNSGPIPVYRAPVEKWGHVDRAVMKAGLALGYGWCPDHNAPEGTGVSPYAINSRAGLRISTNDGYLEPARGRPNLTIVGNAIVDTLSFEGNRAACQWRGRVAWVGGEARSVRARREVLLCAGAIHSPAVLQRSGIGPRAWLEPLGIKLVADRPVGQHLLDHPILSVLLDLKDDAQASTLAHRHTNCCIRYISGLAGAGDQRHDRDRGQPAAGRGRRHRARPHRGVGLRRLSARARCASRRAIRRSIRRSTSACCPTTATSCACATACSACAISAVHPEVRRSRPASSTARRACRSRTTLSPQTLDDWMFAECSDAQHASGTCRMGAADDPRSVVDPECRVIGVTGLRVIDASIMPTVVRANTHFTTVMIAEKMADVLKRFASVSLLGARPPGRSSSASQPMSGTGEPRSQRTRAT